jgi:serine/threonine-protein kinase
MTSIGHYELLSVLGDGGMGTVYKARDPRFDRTVAIKVLHAHIRREPGVAERFRTEAVIQAKLQHPHIVTVLDFVDDGERLAIVQEFVAGQPLDELLRTKGAQPSGWAARVLDQVAGALGHAHAQGLVHRDVKPSNILIAELDGQPLAKVTDFGIAKVLGTEKLRTATGAKMGTLAYMAPEHIRSPNLVDARSDIYALGAVLYEMLTGRPAFEAETEYGLMEAILRQEVSTPSAVEPSVPSVLDAVVQRAMAKDPPVRFQSCADMRQALEGCRRAAEASTLPRMKHGQAVVADRKAKAPSDTVRAVSSARQQAASVEVFGETLEEALTAVAGLSPRLWPDDLAARAIAAGVREIDGTSSSKGRSGSDGTLDDYFMMALLAAFMLAGLIGILALGLS